MTKRAKKSSHARALAAKALVSVIDDDESVRESLPDLLRELGFAAKAFASADEFLTSDSISATRCLLLDVAMPGMSGPELQHELTVRDHAIERHPMMDPALRSAFRYPVARHPRAPRDVRGKRVTRRIRMRTHSHSPRTRLLNGKSIYSVLRRFRTSSAVSVETWAPKRAVT
jgi:Response regulator receiver domain